MAAAHPRQEQPVRRPSFAKSALRREELTAIGLGKGAGVGRCYQSRLSLPSRNSMSVYFAVNPLRISESRTTFSSSGSAAQGPRQACASLLQAARPRPHASSVHVYVQSGGHRRGVPIRLPAGADRSHFAIAPDQMAPAAPRSRPATHAKRQCPVRVHTPMALNLMIRAIVGDPIPCSKTFSLSANSFYSERVWALRDE